MPPAMPMAQGRSQPTKELKVLTLMQPRAVSIPVPPPWEGVQVWAKTTRGDCKSKSKSKKERIFFTRVSLTREFWELRILKLPNIGSFGPISLSSLGRSRFLASREGRDCKLRLSIFVPLSGRIIGMRYFAFVLLSLFTLTLTLTLTSPVRADECDIGNIPSLDEVAVQRCLDKLKNWVAAVSPAQEKNKADLEAIQRQVAQLASQIKGLGDLISNKQLAIAKKDKEFDLQLGELGEAVRSMYVRSQTAPGATTILLGGSLDEAVWRWGVYSAAIRQDREVIVGITEKLQELRTEKAALEGQQQQVAGLKAQVAVKEAEMAKAVAEVEQALGKLEGQIASLTARQQEILAAKSGSFIASVGDSELADDYNASIKGFRESAPAGSLAVFSFGAYTHRKGMSQYGARGRAQSGKGYREILRAYYGKEPVNKDTGGTISVAGYGNLDFENYYLMGIAEMPSAWHPDALKAQAVAARTYAYRYKQSGGTICTSEDCQVFRKSKADSPPEAWKQAVISTRGEVLEDVVTYYSSTTGGYITTVGWDTTDGGGGSDFFERSYEKIGGSPWAYKAWYAKGYDPNGDKCGRSNPWLGETEFADIINAALVLKNTDDGRVTPVTTSCWGGNPYSHDELRGVAGKYGGIGSVSSVSVAQGNGSTNEVIVNGSIHLSGVEFRKAFNLRAPGYLRVPQAGFAFFNIERK